MLVIAVSTQSLTTKSNSTAKAFPFGYSITVYAGEISPEHNCGQDYTIGVVNSTDIIYTGLPVYVNWRLGTPLPDCVIVSTTGWTTGMAFYVVNGYVAGPAIAC